MTIAIILDALRKAHNAQETANERHPVLHSEFGRGTVFGLAEAIRTIEQIQAAPRGGGVVVADDDSKANGWVGYVTRRFTRWMGSKIGEEKWVDVVLFDPTGVKEPVEGGIPARYFHTDMGTSILKEAPKHDAVLVTEGAFRGQVGYLKGLEKEGVTVTLFTPAGALSEQTLPYDHVFCLGD